MNKMSDKTVNKSGRHIEVYAQWAGLLEPCLMGILHATPARGKEIFSFEYAVEWLSNNKSYILDPGLQFFQGVQYAPQTQGNFSVFLDSAPDRWGGIFSYKT
jgi:serine/threonine-protein kinase HipA